MVRSAKTTGALRRVEPWTPVLLDIWERGEPEPLFHSSAEERAYLAATRKDCTFTEIAGILAEDPPLVRKIRGLANSARFGREGAFMGIRTSVGRVGMEGIRELLMVVCLERKAEIPGHEALSGRLVARAPAVGFCALRIADRVGVDPFDAFLGGLLHDVGWAVTYRLLAEFADAEGVSLPDSASEQHRAAHDAHAELGARQVQGWNLGPRVAEAIRWHHRPEKAGESLSLAQVIRASIELMDLLRYHPDGTPPDPSGPPCLSAVGLKGPELSSVLDQLRKDLSLESPVARDLSQPWISADSSQGG